jgi:hypothetical protein
MTHLTPGAQALVIKMYQRLRGKVINARPSLIINLWDPLIRRARRAAPAKYR